jgi:folate-binding protein YgfZ
VGEDSPLGQRYARESAAVFDRSYRGIVDLSGGSKPLGEFLHGIFSSDVKSLEPGGAQHSCFLSSKGRLLAAFRLHALPGVRYRMALLEPLDDGVLKPLGKYCFLSDVNIEEPGLKTLSVEGPEAERVLRLAGVAGELPEPSLASTGASLAGAPVTIIRAGESPAGGYELWVDRDSLESTRGVIVEAARQAGGGLADLDAAEALRIEAGIAHRGKDYGADDVFPAEVGREHALTYDKCYVGQEVVARMRTYGHANRRLKGFLFAKGEAPPRPGAAIRSGAGEEVGKLGSCAISDRLGRAIALGMVHRKAWSEASLSVEGSTAAEVRDLPLVRPA